MTDILKVADEIEMYLKWSEYSKKGCYGEDER